MLYFDTETCGLHGPICLIQYAWDDGEIELHNPWYERAKHTIELIEEIVESDICGFNLAFDWFHICQMYTTLILLEDKQAYPIDCIEEYAVKESQARDGPCLKPKSAVDLFLHARKGPFQSLMERDDIRIKRVPTQLAHKLAKELNERIPLPDVYFARKKDPKRRWQVYDCLDEFGIELPDLKDVVLKFAPSSGLKALAGHALDLKVDYVFGDIDLDSKFHPFEQGYAPFATAPFYNKNGTLLQPSPKNWHGKWPQYLEIHADHWEYNRRARHYATDDVKYTRDLYYYFECPESDDDSELACAVAAIRWHGFRINQQEIEQRLIQETKKQQAKHNFNSPQVCRVYLEEVLTDDEKMILTGTKSQILEEICRWTKAETCNDCFGIGCEKCKDGLVESEEPHPAALRARELLNFRHAGKEIDVLKKLKCAGRFHASFKVIGALSGRMSGADGLNPQGINSSAEFRSMFSLAPDGMVLNGGDFGGFELSIAQAAYNEPKLKEDIESGFKPHAIFGSFIFDKSYEEVKATEKLAHELNLYKRAKSGLFAVMYMGNEHTLVERVGATQEQAENGFRRFLERYTVLQKERQKYFDMFCSMRQPNGIGTRVEWHEPAEYIESMLGFRRYFTLENKICKTLFELANDPPEDWLDLKVKIKRREDRGLQTVAGAVRSALFACAFGIQSRSMRAAGNHVIQSTGAGITKSLQRKIWDLQPCGIFKFRVMPMNVHDEIMCATIPQYTPELTKLVENFIKEMKPTIPLINMEWKENLTSWAGK